MFYLNDFQDWDHLKQAVYFEDGSLRDIWIKPFSLAEWQLWADFVNRTFPLRFDFGDGTSLDFGTTGSQIDMTRVLDYWNNPDSGCPSVSINLDGTLVNAYFFDDLELENDITPREIRTFEAHTRLLTYLGQLSELFGKEVMLTAQNPSGPEETLLTISGKSVRPGPLALENLARIHGN